MLGSASGSDSMRSDRVSSLHPPSVASGSGEGCAGEWADFRLRPPFPLPDSDPTRHRASVQPSRCGTLNVNVKRRSLTRRVGVRFVHRIPGKRLLLHSSHSCSVTIPALPRRVPGICLISAHTPGSTAGPRTLAGLGCAPRPGFSLVAYHVWGFGFGTPRISRPSVRTSPILLFFVYAVHRLTSLVNGIWAGASVGCPLPTDLYGGSASCCTLAPPYICL